MSLSAKQTILEKFLSHGSLSLHQTFYENSGHHLGHGSCCIISKTCNNKKNNENDMIQPLVSSHSKLANNPPTRCQIFFSPGCYSTYKSSKNPQSSKNPTKKKKPDSNHLQLSTQTHKKQKKKRKNHHFPNLQQDHHRNSLYYIQQTKSFTAKSSAK